MDLGKSIWQAVWFGVGTEDTPTSDILSHEKVAVVQLVTPVVFLIDMVSPATYVGKLCTFSQTGFANGQRSTCVHTFIFIIYVRAYVHTTYITLCE